MTKSEQIEVLTAEIESMREKFRFIDEQLSAVQNCTDGKAVLHSGSPLIDLIRNARHTAINGAKQ